MMTDNHNYGIPDEGQLDWHLILNENFRKLDHDVEIRDAEANRGQYTPKSGAVFRATDTGNIYIGSGDRWEMQNPPAGERTQIQREGSVQSLVDFGAAGDGETDDADALRQALQTGLSLYVPDQTFLIGSQIELQNAENVSLFGPGTLKLGPDAEAFMFHIKNSRNVTISGLQFDGNKRNQSDNGLIHALNSENITIRECDIFDWGDTDSVQSQRHTIMTSGCQGVDILWNKIWNTSAKGVSFYAGSDTQRADGCRIVGNRVENTGEDGLFAGTEHPDGASQVIIGFNTISNTRSNYGVRIGGSKRCDAVITGNQIDGASLAAIAGKTLGQSRYLISQNQCVGNNGIDVSSNGEPLGAIVSNNVISDCTDTQQGLRFLNGCSGIVASGNYANRIQIEGGNRFSVFGNITYGNGIIANNTTDIERGFNLS